VTSRLAEVAIIQAVKPCSHVLIVDECRNTGSLSETLFAMLHEKLAQPPKIKRLTAQDSFIPLGRAATVTLPSKVQIIKAVLELLRKRQGYSKPGS
jgi:2-oxoisovalerate dehydrogenase E1 component